MHSVDEDDEDDDLAKKKLLQKPKQNRAKTFMNSNTKFYTLTITLVILELILEIGLKSECLTNF